jgi:hypothetical protein
VSAFSEHFIDKYFAYRRRYVDYIRREAPARASLAVLSEIARLGFMITGNAFCALILGALCAGAAERPGGAGLWPALFGALTLVPAAFALLALRGLRDAVADRARTGNSGVRP